MRGCAQIKFKKSPCGSTLVSLHGDRDSEAFFEAEGVFASIRQVDGALRATRDWVPVREFVGVGAPGWCWIVKVNGPRMAFYDGRVFRAFESAKFGIDVEAVSWVMPVDEPTSPEVSQ